MNKCSLVWNPQYIRHATVGSCPSMILPWWVLLRNTPMAMPLDSLKRCWLSWNNKANQRWGASGTTLSETKKSSGLSKDQNLEPQSWTIESSLWCKLVCRGVNCLMKAGFTAETQSLSETSTKAAGSGSPLSSFLLFISFRYLSWRKLKCILLAGTLRTLQGQVLHYGALQGTVSNGSGRESAQDWHRKSRD